MSSSQIAELVVACLRSCLGAHDGPVALHEPEIGERERALVEESLRSGWVSTGGPFVAEFEKRLSSVTASGHAVACVNGTAALQLALLLAGVQPNDEVLIPALTFVATANAVRYVGAVPHFVDADPTTLGVDSIALDRHLRTTAVLDQGRCANRATGRRISALVPVHVFGHPAAMDALVDVAESYEIPIVEDATEALGSAYKDRACGTFGSMGVLSFNGNKIVTTGGGGAVLTDDEGLARRARHISTTAKQPHPWEYRHDEVGFNYRMPSLNAALGCAQLERLSDLLDRKRRLAERYAREFAGIEGVEVVCEPPNARSNYWLNAVKVPSAVVRDEVLELTNRAGFQTRPAWVPLNELPMFAEFPRAPLDVTGALAARLVNLPSSAKLA